MNEYTHLIYSYQYNLMTNSYDLVISAVKTDDIFHTIGEYIWRSLYKIDRITFVEYSDKKVDYLIKKGYEIHNFSDKYKKESDDD